MGGRIAEAHFSPSHIYFCGSLVAMRRRPADKSSRLIRQIRVELRRLGLQDVIALDTYGEETAILYLSGFAPVWLIGELALSELREIPEDTPAGRVWGMLVKAASCVPQSSVIEKPSMRPRKRLPISWQSPTGNSRTRSARA